MQIERANDHSIWAVFKNNTSHSLSTVNTDTDIELFSTSTLNTMKDFKFEGFDLETNLEAGWLFNWPRVQPNPNPPDFSAVSGSQATEQPSFIEFINLDTQPWSTVRLDVSNHLQEDYNQVSMITSNLSTYTALGIIYFQETETFSSATTYVSNQFLTPI